MRIIVISDTHRDFKALWDIVEKHKGEAALFIHLGDGEREVDDLLCLYPDLPLRYVRGNCDFGSFAKTVDIVCAGEERILITHGHTCGVKASTGPLSELARENNCRIALYGHTHKNATGYQDGLYLMNPGSPSCPRDSKPSYGIIDLVGGGVFLNIVEL